MQVTKRHLIVILSALFMRITTLSLRGQNNVIAISQRKMTVFSFCPSNFENRGYNPERFAGVKRVVP